MSAPWRKAAELCSELGITRRTLQRWHKAGGVERRQVGPGHAGIRWRLLTEAERAQLAKVRRGVTNEYGEYV
jgi:hypothetical protein